MADAISKPTSSRTPQPSRIWLPTERSRVGAVASGGPSGRGRSGQRDDRLAERAERAQPAAARRGGATRPAGGCGGREHRGQAAREQRALRADGERQRDARRLVGERDVADVRTQPAREPGLDGDA